MDSIDYYRDILGYSRNQTLSFGEFLEKLEENPKSFLQTSSTLIAQATKHFGYKIVIRSGEPMISYNIFRDRFDGKSEDQPGANAVFGQEFCIKHLVDMIDSAAKEAGPNRGIVLVGPPASGKTNILDLISIALEEYTKKEEVKLYSFFFEFNSEDQKRKVEIWNPFRHNPILLFPTVLSVGNETRRPRAALFEKLKKSHPDLLIPVYYQTAALDKASLDILEGLMQKPGNREKTLFDIYEAYIRIEEITFSNARAKSLSNIDDMRMMRIQSTGMEIGPEDQAVIDEHLPSRKLRRYNGAMVDSNRGIMHIHDAFGVDGSGSPSELDYKPLLMILGSGKVSVDSTQAAIDNTIMMTTNLEEMKQLDKQLTSSKLLDRVEKIPVNYLLDANSEMDILQRDMANMKENYEVDPNLLRVASYYAVMTRLLPPQLPKSPPHWSEAKVQLYKRITVEQKLMIYQQRAEDPITTIQKIPHWHPFRNEALRLDLDLDDPSSWSEFIENHPNAVPLYQSGLFSNEDLSMIDDEFMRVLWNEHYPQEGKHGISVRQLQNIMRNTIANSDGLKVHVGTFLSQLKKVIAEGPHLHHWLYMDQKFTKDRRALPSRKIGGMIIPMGDGDYGDFSGLVQVVKALYFNIIRKEITMATVDRDPAEIEADLRRYIQYSLLANALENKAFAHIMVPKFSFIHPTTGEKVDSPDFNFMTSIEKVIASERDPNMFRKEMAHKFLELQSKGEIFIEEGKTVINSKNDNLILCFGESYSALLSHRKTVEGINAELLRDAFFQKRNNRGHYDMQSVEIRTLVENILDNMHQRFKYPKSIALDTVVYALRKNIIDFEKMIS